MRFSTRKLLSLALCTVLLAGAASQVACGEKDVERFAAISLKIQQGLERGIPIARSLRESGTLDAQFNLRLAKQARLFNEHHANVIDLVLKSDVDGGELSDQLNFIIDEAKKLREDGKINIHGKTEIIFDLSIDLARSELADLADELKGKRGIKIPVTESARAKLERAKATAARNAAALDEAIERLSNL
jgi:hypothetical protein